MSLEFLKNVKSGDTIVRVLIGGGFSSESLVDIEFVNDNSIFIEGADEDYENDSVYRFSKSNGRSVNNFTPGFYSKLVRVATEEDIKEMSDL